MASIFGHFVAGFSIAKLWNEHSLWIILLAMISAFLPDIDVISFALGIPYEHMLGHRGFTHSIVFALLWGGLVSLFFKKKRRLIFAIILFSTLSHSILDAMTNGGLGVAFFAPFSGHRYFFSWRPIQVSPIGIAKFFSKWGWLVIKSEIIYIIFPFFSVLAVHKIYLISKRRRK